MARPRKRRGRKTSRKTHSRSLENAIKAAKKSLDNVKRVASACAKGK